MGIRRALITLALACVAAAPAVGQDAYGPIGLAGLGPLPANTVVGNATSGTAVPTALPAGSCSTASSALNWTTNTGFGCNTSITAAAVPASGLTGATLASGVTASSLLSAAGGSFATAAFVATGTSGATIPLLNGTNTWSADNTFTGKLGIGAAATFDLDITKTSTGAVEGRIQNSSSGNSAQAVFNLTTGISNSYALMQIINNTGAPYYQISGGPGLVHAYFDMPDFDFRNTSGTSRLKIDTSGNAYPGSDNAYTLGASGSTWKGLWATLTSDAASTDATMCNLTTGETRKGSGTIGICLGTSSELFKYGIADLDVGLVELRRLKPIRYHLDAAHDSGDRKEYYGFGAWAMAYVLPGLVGRGTDGNPQSADYLGMVPVNTRAIVQVDDKVELLTKRVSTLEARR